MLKAKTELVGSEIQASPFADDLRESLTKILNNDFFSSLEHAKISKKGYEKLIKEKYSAVGYFIPLLENAEKLALPTNTVLSNVFKQNRFDEIGYFAGADHEEYAHSTWRKRSLSSFGISTDNLTGPTLDSTKEHNKIMEGLSKSNDAFEVFGCLLFLELFVVYEMKHLIRTLERDMPDLFPKDGYSYDNFPFNTHEYWYGHALHDTWHFRQIEEKLKNLVDDTNLASLRSGISKTAQAKSLLYSRELFEMVSKE